MPRKKKDNSIPLKNYVVATAVIVGCGLLCLYAYKWVKVFNEKKVGTSYLVETKTITNEITGLDNVEEIFAEAPDNYFIYISYTGDEKIYNMEKNLKKLIDDYKLNNEFYYINVTSIKDKTNYIDQLNSKLHLEDNKITKVPTIIYVEDGEVGIDNIVTRRDNQIMEAADFEHLLDIKDFSK